MKETRGIIIVLILTGFVLYPCVNLLRAQEKEAGQQDKSPGQPQEGQGKAGQEKTGQARAPGDEAKKSLTPSVPVMEIKRLESEAPLYSIELRNVQLIDFFRVIAHDYDLNIIVDPAVRGTVTASFTSIALEEALDGIAELSNLIIQKKGNIFRVSPHLVTETFVLKYTEAKKILQGAAAVPGAGTAAAPAGTGTPAAPAGTGTPAAGGVSGASSAQESTIFDLLSEQGRLFLGEKPNSVIVSDYPTNVKKIGEYLNMVDQKMTSRVFKLKYLKATDVVGQPAAATGTTAAATAATAAAGSSGGGQ